MKKILFIFAIALMSCDREEFTEDVTITVTKYPENDTIVAVPYREDTLINQVGCYYPIYPYKNNR